MPPSLLDEIWLLQIDPSKAEGDMMFHHSTLGERHYLYVGRSILLVLKNAINICYSYPGGDRPIKLY
jgi:hypothetical protein